MNISDQAINQYESAEELKFSNQADDDREDDDREEESGDWGDVDPAGGEEPTAPGSAV